jgi:hypothetical protein
VTEAVAPRCWCNAWVVEVEGQTKMCKISDGLGARARGCGAVAVVVDRRDSTLGVCHDCGTVFCCCYVPAVANATTRCPARCESRMAPVKERRLAVPWQGNLLADQKANKCWMHTVPEVASMFGSNVGRKGAHGPGVAAERARHMQTPNGKCSQHHREQQR